MLLAIEAGHLIDLFFPHTKSCGQDPQPLKIHHSVPQNKEAAASMHFPQLYVFNRHAHIFPTENVQLWLLQ